MTAKDDELTDVERELGAMLTAAAAGASFSPDARTAVVRKAGRRRTRVVQVRAGALAAAVLAVVGAAVVVQGQGNGGIGIVAGPGARGGGDGAVDPVYLDIPGLTYQASGESDSGWELLYAGAAGVNVDLLLEVMSRSAFEDQVDGLRREATGDEAIDVAGQPGRLLETGRRLVVVWFAGEDTSVQLRMVGVPRADVARVLAGIRQDETGFRRLVGRSR